VVGLGPAGPELVTAGTLVEIERVPFRFLRTTRHPAASVLEGSPSFDAIYESADDFAEVYRRIADDLVAAARREGEVLYAVPGSPRVLERSVDLLVELGDDPGSDIEVEVRPALSFLDLAWVRLGIDPLEDGVRLVDGHRFAERAAGQRGPLLVAHCHNQRVLSDIKLAVDEPLTTPVTVIQRLGLPDERIVTVAWAELDREVEADHLTALYIPELAAPVAGEVQAFVELVGTLREQCPWDREQTHRSLTRHLLEESYEVIEAIEALPEGADGTDPAYAHLEEELGDLLFQVVFHAEIGAEVGAFTMADVARGIHDKLVRRHPHVFAGASDDLDDINRRWEEIKRDEHGRESVMDGVPTTLPALLYALKVLRKAESVDQAWTPTGDDLGERLLTLVAQARADGIDPETALRAAANRVRDAVRAAGA
jgi:tetrapyrrole methylase family protein/MazG family protein